MFDIGFSEFLLIGVVALIVIGPERLPKVARTIGHLVGRMQRYVADVKSDINREMELDELRKMRDTMQEAASGIESSLKEELHKTESDLNSAAASLAQDEVSRAQGTAPAIEENPAGIAPPSEAKHEPTAGPAGEDRKP